MRDLRICFVGDSFVNGVGDRDGLGWAGRICNAARSPTLAITRYDLGVRRDTSAQVLRRCAGEVAARLDGVACDGRVALSFGTNDAVHEDGKPRVEPEATLAHARALLGWSRARWPTLFVGPPPLPADAALDARVARLVDAFAALATQLDVPFLDLRAALVGDATWRDEALVGDGAHPGAGGYARAAQVVAAWPAWRAWLAP